MDIEISGTQQPERDSKSIKNLAHFRPEEYTVNMEYTQGGKSFRDCLKAYFIGQRKV
ncbi:MAG: hypothetical protein LBM69_09690 [Lachnospiraceae bacterium]|nr:hypothetical protein [Lachnospiraceae bacterium]